VRLLADYFVRYRPLVGVFLLTVTGLAAWGYMPVSPTESPISRSLDNDEEPVDDESDAEKEPLLTENRWRREDAITGSFDLGSSESFLVVECDNLFRRESVRALREMVRRLEALPVVENVFWLDEIPVLNAFGFADPLLPSSGAVPESFPQVRERVLHHPLVRGQLLSPDGTTMIMPVVYNWLYLEDENQLTDGVVSAARAALEEQRARLPESVEPPQFRVRITGNLPLFLAREEAFSRNQTFYRLTGYGLALLLSVVLLRGVAAVGIVSVAPMLGVFWCFGILQLCNVHINELANVVMPVLVSMIGLTDGIHLLVNIRDRRAAGDSPVEASRWAIEHVGVACFLTSLTTAIGFGSLMLAHSNFVQDFGKACMYGVVIAFCAVVTFVPFIASTRLGTRVDRGRENDVISPLLLRSAWLLDVILRKRKLVSVCAVSVTLAMAVISLALKPDSRIANQLPSSTEAYQALAHCDENVGGIQFHQVRIRWPETLGEDSPQILAAIHDVETILETEPLVSHPLSIRNMLASFPGNPNDFQTQMTFLSLLPRELRGFFHQPDERLAVIVTRVQDRGIRHYQGVFNRLDEEFAQLENKYQGFEIWQAGGPVYSARELYQIVLDLITSLGAASGIILVVLAVVYRSVRIGLISVIPNMFPLVATGTLLVLMGEPLFISSVCAFTVCLGIAVDDTIHFLSRYRQEVQLDDDVDNAVRRTFLHVGTPMLMTTVILVTGFGTVLFSDLPAHRIFGAMACATISTAIIGDLIALPALLATLEGSRGYRRFSARLPRIVPRLFPSRPPLPRPDRRR